MRRLRQLPRLVQFWLKYGRTRSFTVEVGDTTAQFALEDLQSRSWFLPRYDRGKIHEPLVTKLVSLLLRRAKLFVDVGAHLGYFSCIAAKQLGDNGNVVAFELDERSYRRARRNLSFGNCNNAEIFHRAVCDHSNGVSYWRSRWWSGPALSMAHQRGDQRISVRSICLDDFFAERRTVPTLIKIDVEGAEEQVLRGMSETLERDDADILLELHDPQLRLLGSSAPEVIAHLKARGYQVYGMPSFRQGSLASFEEVETAAPNTFVFATRGTPPDPQELNSISCTSTVR